RGRRPPRPGADRRLDPSLRPLALAAPHRPGALQPAGTRHPGSAAPAGDLRHARPCRARGSTAADRPDGADELLPAAPAGAQHLLALLARRGYRIEFLSYR